MTSQLYILFEHAIGYSVFFVTEFEDIGLLIPQVEVAIAKSKKFKKLVKIIGFFPFGSAVQALTNCNAISEGVVTDELKDFLKSTLPKVSKKNPYQLGVSDSKLGVAIYELLSINCCHTDVVPEIIRGIRQHFSKLLQGFTDQSSSVAQLGLGHAYSRCKVKFNVHRVDNMIIQSSALLDQFDKNVNIFAMRLRECYSNHFPELVKIVPDCHQYAKLIKLFKGRQNCTEEILDEIEKIVMDREKAEEIISASKSSIGVDLKELELNNIEMFADLVLSMCGNRYSLSNYLQSKMQSVAPNLSALIGDQVGARLISKAGSLTNLAKFPASTVQILGAEKALFRALKKRTKTPKYGLLYHSSFISRANLKNKGRISRFLANKCSIASRIDCFSEKSTNAFGNALKQQVEERLKFYETGKVPTRNVDVMKEVMDSLNE